MYEDVDLSGLIRPAAEWFLQHKRDLPWRRTRDPYRIWVSEIMLQQTRVEAVKPYYARFIERLPDVHALADCPEDELLKLWEGLGYYSRVRNMQKAARQIVGETSETGIAKDGIPAKFPRTYASLLALPGIGSYTAGAIASIAFDEPVPAVDGNVLRVMARVCADDRDIIKEQTKKLAFRALSEVMPKDAPGQFNQALMEIGALVCLPNAVPKCADCPFEAMCLARRDGRTDELPIRKKPAKRRTENRTVLLIMDGSRLLLCKRKETGLLAGLYEFPNVEGTLNRKAALSFARDHHLEPLHIEPLPGAKHIFSHIEWHMTGFLIRVASVDAVMADAVGSASGTLSEGSMDGVLLVEKDAIRTSYPIPSAFEAYASYVHLPIGAQAVAGG